MVDREGHLYVGGVKVARLVPERGTLQFFDKDERRTQRRGSSQVEVRCARLVELLRNWCVEDTTILR
jgi:hypothetical protein